MITDINNNEEFARAVNSISRNNEIVDVSNDERSIMIANLDTIHILRYENVELMSNHLRTLRNQLKRGN